ncbi:MAG: hypothetical protein MJ137_06900 [Clostridia bacterium]|nr:hypothetical protein [Clostridia bacterium]
MKKATRILSAVLSLLMLAAAFAACAEKNPDSETTPAAVATTSPENTSSAVTDKYEIGDKVPANLRFDGEKIVILSRGRDWCKDEVSSESDGNIIHEAVFKRNLNVEERLGVTIENILDPGTDNYTIGEVHIRNQVQSGNNDYSLICASVYASIIHTNENLYIDLMTAENLDLSRPYWFSGFNKAAEFNGSQYFCAGAITLSLYRFTFATFFNRNIFDEHSVPYLYDAVRNKKWTLDYQYEITSVFYSDVNGDGVAQDPTDKYGFISNYDMIGVDAYWSSCKLDILSRNSDGEYEFAPDQDRIGTAVEKINRLFWDNPGTLRVKNKSSDGEQAEIAKTFSEGGAAMTTLRLIEVEGDSMKNMTDDRGVVPMPMLDEEQGEYRSYVHDTMSAFAMPNTGKSEKEINMLGAVLEVMASESYKTITPAYYDVTLKSKYSSDPESVEMLDIITENIYIDPGILYTKSINSVHQQMRTFIKENTKSVTTYFKTVSRTVPPLVKKLNEELAAVGA